MGEGKLLDLDLCTSLLERVFELLGFGLGNFLLQRRGGLVNEVLRFFQTETEEVFDGLDNAKLGLACGCEDNVELGLLGGGGCLSGGTGCNCDSSGGGLDAIFFLEDLCKFLNVLYREVNKLFCKCFDVCHNNCYCLNC